MTDQPTALDLARSASETVLALADLTRPGAGGLEVASDAAGIVEALAEVAALLPQVLRQIAGWVEIEGAAGELLVGVEPLRATTVGITATSALADAGVTATALGRVLKSAHEALAVVSNA